MRETGRPGPEGEVALDPSVVADLLSLRDEDSSGAVDDIITGFLAKTPGRLAALAQASADGDYETLAWSAHSLRGACGIFGAQRMVRLCGELEERAQGGRLRDSQELIAALQAEFGRVRAALEALRGQEGA